MIFDGKSDILRPNSSGSVLMIPRRNSLPWGLMNRFGSHVPRDWVGGSFWNPFLGGYSPLIVEFSTCSDHNMRPIVRFVLKRQTKVVLDQML